MISGALLMLFGYRPLAKFCERLIPKSIQVGTCIGIGLLTALAGATDVNMVQSGNYGTLVQLGPITPSVVIALAGVVLICIALHYQWRGSFCLALVCCSITFGLKKMIGQMEYLV